MKKVRFCARLLLRKGKEERESGIKAEELQNQRVGAKKNICNLTPYLEKSKSRDQTELYSER